MPVIVLHICTAYKHILQWARECTERRNAAGDCMPETPFPGHPRQETAAKVPSPVPRLSSQATPEALPSPILRRLPNTSASGAAPRFAWLGAIPAGWPPRAGGEGAGRSLPDPCAARWPGG